MFRNAHRGPGRALAAVPFALLAIAAPAAAATSAAGGAAYEELDVTAVECVETSSRSCAPGEQLKLRGENLRDTRRVVFLGRRGRADNVKARPAKASPHRVLVEVPATARSGRVRVVADGERATGPRVKVETASAPTSESKSAFSTTGAAEDGGVFPVRGKHDYGTETNHFGGGRGHQGHDVFARCGTPLVSALPGTVTITKWQDRAGHYVVIKADDGTSQAYMHLREPATVTKGQRVEAGTPIGTVGDTGRASGCHLHFELWTAPGWYEGGEPIDPLPALERWDAAS